jgi:hypothetical protein
VKEIILNVEETKIRNLVWCTQLKILNKEKGTRVLKYMRVLRSRNYCLLQHNERPCGWNLWRPVAESNMDLRNQREKA